MASWNSATVGFGLAIFAIGLFLGLLIQTANDEKEIVQPPETWEPPQKETSSRSRGPTRSTSNHKLADKNKKLRGENDELRKEIADLSALLNNKNKELANSATKIESLQGREAANAYLEERAPKFKILSNTSERVRAGRRFRIAQLNELTRLFQNEEIAIAGLKFAIACTKKGFGTPEDLIEVIGAKNELRLRKIIEKARHQTKDLDTGDKVLLFRSYFTKNELYHVYSFSGFYKNRRPLSQWNKAASIERERRRRAADEALSGLR